MSNTRSGLRKLKYALVYLAAIVLACVAALFGTSFILVFHDDAVAAYGGITGFSAAMTLFSFLFGFIGATIPYMLFPSLNPRKAAPWIFWTFVLGIGLAWIHVYGDHAMRGVEYDRANGIASLICGAALVFVYFGRLAFVIILEDRYQDPDKEQNSLKIEQNKP